MTDRARGPWRPLALGAALTLSLAAAPVVLTPAAATAAVAPGTVWEWGSNGFGQLGNGAVSASPSPAAAVPGHSDIADVEGGREHVVALTTSGTVLTWGSNSYGQLGLGDTANHSQPTVVTVPCTGGVKAVDAGHYSTFALCGNGTVWGWGLNADGQIGDGTRTNQRSPVQVQGITDAVSVAAGRDMSYALRANGTMLAWGDNAYGEIGDGTTTDRLTPVAVSGLTGVTSIAPGRDHVLVLRQDGTVWGWGWNQYGQVGDGTTTNRSTPVQIIASGVQELAGGANHSYALTTGGTVLSWGRNNLAELGDGTTTQRTRPVTVLGVANAVSLGSGRDHGAAVLANGSVMAWGYNANGQLGDGTTTNRTQAITVPGISGASFAGGGGAEYTVVLVSGTPTNQPPVASFTVTCQQLACHFDAGASHDPDGTVQSWSWTFGDGATASGSVVDHSFGQSGSFQVTLTVTDDDQATGTSTHTVSVSDGSSPPVAFDGVSTVTASATTTSLRVPSTAKVGDQLLLLVTANRAATLTTPSGWTRNAIVSDGTLERSWAFSRTATSGLPGSSVSLRFDAASKVTATLLSYSGAGAPSAVQGAAETGNTRTHAAPSASVATAGSVVVCYWADKVSTSHAWTLPASLTSRSATTGTGAGMVTSASGDSAAQPVGTWPSVTADGAIASATAISWTIVLPPA